MDDVGASPLVAEPIPPLDGVAKAVGRMRALNQHSWCYKRCGDELVPAARVDSKEGGSHDACLAPPPHQAPLICTWPRLDDRSASVGLVAAISPSPAGHEVDGMCVQVLDVTMDEDYRHYKLPSIVS